MGRIYTIIFTILIIFTGLFSVPVCIEYITATSNEVGQVGDLVKSELTNAEGYYIISYDLDGGTLAKSNPIKYNLFTSTFTLNNPIKEGFDFIGWTGTDLEEPQIDVTICKGSSGNLEFTANYEAVLDTPTIILSSSSDGLYLSWNEIENATGYVVNINGVDCFKTSACNYRVTSNFLKVGENVFKVKAAKNNYTSFSAWSNSVYYSIVNQLNPITLTYSNNVFRFNAVDDAREYVITVGNCSFSFSAYKTEFPNNCITLNNGYYTVDLFKVSETEDDDIPYLFYSSDNNEYINSTNHSVDVTITANAYYSSLIAPAVSNSVSYVYDLAVDFNNLHYSSKPYTHSQLANIFSEYDYNYGSFLAISIPTTFFNFDNESIPDFVYSYCNILVMDIYENGNLITTITAKKYAASTLYHFKSSELTVNHTYTAIIKYKFSEFDSTELQYLSTLSFTCLSSDRLNYFEFI